MDHNSRDRHDSGGEGMRKKTDTMRKKEVACTEAGIGCTGLSARETVAPQKLSVYYRELNRELGL